MQDQESSLGRNLVQQHQEREKVEQHEESREEQRVEQSICWMAQMTEVRRCIGRTDCTTGDLLQGAEEDRRSGTRDAAESA